MVEYSCFESKRQKIYPGSSAHHAWFTFHMLAEAIIHSEQQVRASFFMNFNISYNMWNEVEKLSSQSLHEFLCRLHEIADELQSSSDKRSSAMVLTTNLIKVTFR